MTRFVELYRNGDGNGNIASGNSEVFGQDTADYEARSKYGSHNTLTVLNSSTKEYSISLNGEDARTFQLPSTGSFQIKPEEGVFFDFIVITNTSAEQIDADDITVAWATAQEVS